MVSEAKKPLVISITFLVIFVSILASVGIYMLVEILNQNKSITPSATDVLSETKNNDDKSSKSLTDLIKTQKALLNAKNKFKKNIKKRAGSAETGTEAELEETDTVELKNIIEAYDDLDLGKGPLQDYDKLLNEFEDEILSKYPDENESKVEMRSIETNTNNTEGDASIPLGIICKTYKVANAFGVRGSQGHIGGYFSDLTSSPPSDISTKSFSEIGDDMEVIFENDLKVNELFCHVKIIAAKPEVLPPGAISTEIITPTPIAETTTTTAILNIYTIQVLVESLLTDSSWKPEALQLLNIPKPLIMLVGIAPEQSLHVPLILHSLNRIFCKTQASIISNALSLPGIGGFSIIRDQEQDSPHIFRYDSFESSTNYKKRLRKHDFEQFSVSRLELENGLNFTVYYGTKKFNAEDVHLHALITENLEEICRAMIDGAWISTFHSIWYSDNDKQKKYLRQLKESSYAFLFIFDGKEDFDLNSIKGFNENEKLMEEEINLIRSDEINSLTIAESYFLNNLAGDPTRKGYQFILRPKYYNPDIEKELIHEFVCSKHQFVVKGLDLENSKVLASIIVDLIKSNQDNQTLAVGWKNNCENTKGILHNQYYFNILNIFETSKYVNLMVWKL